MNKKKEDHREIKENLIERTRRQFLTEGLAVASGAAAVVGLASPSLAAQEAPAPTASADGSAGASTPQVVNAVANVDQMTAAPGGGFNYRQDWGYLHGEFTLNLSWPPGVVTSSSYVYVSISEADANGVRFLGAAKFSLNNVVPRQDLIQSWVTVNWGSDIRLFADYLVFT